MCKKDKQTISSEFSFDSAHFLPGYTGKCKNIHGHRWRCIVTITGDIIEEGSSEDMILDFTDFKKSLKEVENELDHKLLITEGSISQAFYDMLVFNHFEIVTFPFRTVAENMSKWIAYHLKEEYNFNVVSVTLYETPNNWSTYIMKEED